MIFIPAGMFHFVFSEDPDPESGLCVAMNFWYEHSHGPGNDEGDPNEKAQLGCHDIHLKFNEILQILKRKNFTAYETDSKCFIPSITKSFFPEISLKEHKTNFDVFYKARNLNQYIAQFHDREFDKFAVPYKNKLKDSAIWINWGNCRTLPHYDGMDNWLCQLKGTRRVILIPQHERHLLYILNPYPVSLLGKLYNKMKNNNKCDSGNVIDVKVNFSTPSDVKVPEPSDVKVPEPFAVKVHFSTPKPSDNEVYDSEIKCKQNIISLETINTILKNLQNNDETICMCKEFMNSYLNKPLVFSFISKQYKENEFIENMGTLWVLTHGKIQIKQTIIDATPGSVIYFPKNSNFIVKALNNCIVTLPHGFCNGN